MTHLHCRLGFFVLLMLLAPGLATASTPQASPVTAPYELVVLADASYGDRDQATDVNASGVAIGTSCRGMLDCAPAVWTAPDDVEELPKNRWHAASASAINDAGDIAGSVEMDDSEFYPAIWQDGDLTILETTGDVPGTAMAINDRGQVAGSISTGDMHADGVLWNAGVPAPLGSLPNHTCNMPFDINNEGVVVGTSSPDCEIWRAAIWDESGPASLPLIIAGDEDDPFRSLSTAWAINDAGVAVGFAVDATGTGKAVVWEEGDVTLLEGLAGAIGCQATDINDTGMIVGGCDMSYGGSSLAVVWEGGTPSVLPGGVASEAWQVNEAGVIVGEVDDEQDQARAAMWIPTDLAGDASLTPAGVVTEFPGVRLPGRRAARSRAGTVLKGGLI